MAEKVINCRGMQCPGPIVQLFQATKQAAAGDILVIEATDGGFKRDVQAWCRKTGNELLSLENDAGVLRARIKKA
ncbi:MAG: SirA family protein [Firmicutes bacterium]|jgi:tRNA 2-thiouridine synthesizing protein A|nr:SirA family protein [Bacillota bacterium]